MLDVALEVVAADRQELGCLLGANSDTIRGIRLQLHYNRNDTVGFAIPRSRRVRID